MAADPRAQYATAMAALTSAREEQMLDAGVAVRPAEQTATPVLDEDGNVVTTEPVEVYNGPCTIVDPTQVSRAARIVTDESGVPTDRVLQVPHRADLRPGDIFTVTASAFSPGLVDDRFVVMREDERSYATHRSYRVRGSSWPSPETST